MAFGRSAAIDELEQSVGDFRRLRPDIVVDAIAFTERQGESLMSAFRGIATRVVVLSSGDVYRANDILFRRVQGAAEPTPLSESSPLRERLYPYRGVPIPAAYGITWDDYDKILVERAVLGCEEIRRFNAEHAEIAENSLGCSLRSPRSLR